MPNLIVMGSEISCTFGEDPATFLVPIPSLVTATAFNAATIMDYVPMLNILPFGDCVSPVNPAVIAATAAGSPPPPCLPIPLAPWAPGSPLVTIGGLPALNDACMLTCMWAGVITFTESAQELVEVS